MRTKFRIAAGTLAVTALPLQTKNSPCGLDRAHIDMTNGRKTSDFFYKGGFRGITLGYMHLLDE